MRTAAGLGGDRARASASPTGASMAAPARTAGLDVAVAAVRELARREALPPGPIGVLRVDPTLLHASVLAGLDEVVLACRHVPVRAEQRAGEAWLEPAVRLLAAAAADAGHQLPTLTGGIALIGGYADTPALSARLAGLAGEPPWVLTAAAASGSGPVPISRPVLVRPVGAGRDSAAAPHRAAEELGAGLLPATSPSRRVGRPLVGVLTVLLAGLLTAVVASRLAGRAAPPGPATAGPAVLAQYDYTLRLPAGWRHTGGLPERRRTLLTPVRAPAGSDLISVEQTPLGYDSAAERDRAYRELHQRFQRASAADPGLDQLTLSTTFAGREVIAYRQWLPRTGAMVDWYVLFDRDAQLSVGCQHTRSGAAAVRAACAEVVASLSRRDPGPTPR